MKKIYNYINEKIYKFSRYMSERSLYSNIKTEIDFEFIRVTFVMNRKYGDRDMELEVLYYKNKYSLQLKDCKNNINTVKTNIEDADEAYRTYEIFWGYVLKNMDYELRRFRNRP